MNILLIFIIVILCIVNLFFIYKICNHKLVENSKSNKLLIEEFRAPTSVDIYYNNKTDVLTAPYFPTNEINSLYLHLYTCFEFNFKSETSTQTTDDINLHLNTTLSKFNNQYQNIEPIPTTSETSPEADIGFYFEPYPPTDKCAKGEGTTSKFKNIHLDNLKSEISIKKKKIRRLSNIKKLTENNKFISQSNSLILLNIRFTQPKIVSTIKDSIDKMFNEQIIIIGESHIDDLINIILSDVNVTKLINIDNTTLKNHFIKEIAVIFSEYLFLKLQTSKKTINIVKFETSIYTDVAETDKDGALANQMSLFMDHVRLVVFLHNKVNDIKFEYVKVQFYTFLFYSFRDGKVIFKDHIKDLDTKPDNIINKFFSNYEFEGLYKLFIIALARQKIYYDSDYDDADILRFGLHYEFIEENKDLLKLNTDDFYKYYQNINYLKVHFFDKKTIHTRSDSNFASCYTVLSRDKCKQNENCIWSNPNKITDGRCAVKQCEDKGATCSTSDSNIDKHRILFSYNSKDKGSTDHFMKNFNDNILTEPKNFFSILDKIPAQYTSGESGCLGKSENDGDKGCLKIRSTVITKCKYSKQLGCFSEDLLEKQCHEYNTNYDREGCNNTKVENTDNFCFWNYKSERCFNLNAPISWVNKFDTHFIGSTDAQSCSNFTDEDSCYDKRCVWAPTHDSVDNEKCRDIADRNIA